eukprot:scaffold14929_cov154-Skeletonema_marinoi.AAC.1
MPWILKVDEQARRLAAGTIAEEHCNYLGLIRTLPLSKKRSLYRICMMFGSFCCCCDVVEEKPKPKAEESSKNEGKVNVVSPNQKAKRKKSPPTQRQEVKTRRSPQTKKQKATRRRPPMQKEKVKMKMGKEKSTWTVHARI